MSKKQLYTVTALHHTHGECESTPLLISNDPGLCLHAAHTAETQGYCFETGDSITIKRLTLDTMVSRKNEDAGKTHILLCIKREDGQWEFRWNNTPAQRDKKIFERSYKTYTKHHDKS